MTILAFPFIPLLWISDYRRRRTVLHYDLDPDFNILYTRFVNAFLLLAQSKKIWHVKTDTAVENPKYHAGDTASLNTDIIKLKVAKPRFLSSTMMFPTLATNGQTIYFLPDTILIAQGAGFAEIAYHNITFIAKTCKIIERNELPSDAERVGTTWKYVNADNMSPDQQFKDNCELPIMQYAFISFPSDFGLTMDFMASDIHAMGAFAARLKEMCEFFKKLREQETNGSVRRVGTATPPS